MFWPGYLPDEFEYLRVVDYLVGGAGGGERGGGGGGGRSNKRHLFSSTFRPPPPRSPLSFRPGLKKMQDYNILCSPLKRVASFLKIFSCRTRSITEKIASSFIKAVYFIAQYQEAITETSSGST